MLKPAENRDIFFLWENLGFSLCRVLQDVHFFALAGTSSLLFLFLEVTSLSRIIAVEEFSVERSCWGPALHTEVGQGGSFL